jgi:hypothetical protein
VDEMGGWDRILEIQRLAEEVGGWDRFGQLLAMLKL